MMFKSSNILCLFVLVTGAHSLKLLVDNGNEYFQRKHKNAIEGYCIEDYSGKLNAVKDGLGDHIQNRYKTFDFAGVRSDAYGNENIFGVGLGTTATRSLSTAMHMMGLEGSHFSPGSPEESLAFKLGLNMKPFRAQNPAKQVKPGSEKCYQHMEKVFPRQYHVKKGEFAMDDPVAQLFLDMFLTYPDAKFILTNRNATQWATARWKFSKRELAPLQEPCGYKMIQFTHEQNVAMYDAHVELVRCMVPQERLLEFNVFNDPIEKQKNLAADLSAFVGKNQLLQFPGSKKKSSASKSQPSLRLTEMEESETPCRSHQDILKLYRKGSLKLKDISTIGDGDRSEIFSVRMSFENGSEELQMNPERLGMMIHYAAQMDCEVSLA